MTLDYTTFGLVKITMLDYISEALFGFDKADPTGVGNKSIAVPSNIFKVHKTVKNLIPRNLWSFITWWQRYYLLPSGIVRTHAP